MEEVTLFQKFKKGIVEILKVEPKATSEILKIKVMYPDDCDDSVRCIHKNVDYGRPEWEHIVRSAQQALKKSNIIDLNQGSKKWELKLKNIEE